MIGIVMILGGVYGAYLLAAGADGYAGAGAGGAYHENADPAE